MTKKPDPPPHDLENGNVWTPNGYVPYEYWGRYCIRLESGMTEQEARRVAAEDLRREEHERMGHGGR